MLTPSEMHGGSIHYQKQSVTPPPRVAEPQGKGHAFFTVRIEPSRTEVPYAAVRSPLPLSVSFQTGHALFSAPHLAGSVPGCLGVDGSEPKEMHPKKLRILRMELLKASASSCP